MNRNRFPALTGKTLFFLWLIISLFSACTGKMSLEEAREVVVSVGDKTLTAPPRRIDDILSVLNQSVQDDSTVRRKLRAEIEKPPPATHNPATLAAYYHRRGDAFIQMGRQSRALAAPRKQQMPEVIQELKIKIEALSSARIALAEEIKTRFPKYTNFTNPKPVSIVRLQKNLRPGEVFTTVYSVDDKSYVWAVPRRGRTGFCVVPLGRQKLFQMVADLRKALDPKPTTFGDIPEFDTALAYELYRSLLEPVKKNWQSAKDLLIVAHGPLGQLAEAQKENQTKTTVVAYQPGHLNVRGIRVSDEGTLDSDKIVSCTLEKLNRLPDTSAEIKHIAEALGADPDEDVFLGRQASEQQVKSMDLSDRKVVAFATHALVPGDLDGLDQPALALSAPSIAGSDEDGLLTMSEILRLKLNADWVVLSACNTGAAAGKGAEAVSGLGRAFFYAGTRAILVSMWPVETTSARELTTGLFRYQQADQSLSRARALQKSALALIDGLGMKDPVSGKIVASYAHPLFWAPFIMVGESGHRTN